jgi:hypothetical protein
MSSARQAYGISPAAKAVPAPASAHPITDLGAELGRLDEEWERMASEHGHAWQESLATMSPEELRAGITRLKEQLDGLTDPEGRNAGMSIHGRISGMLAQLARVDAEATLAWINGHFPSLRRDFMASWADVDPDAALKAVIASKRKPPCSYDTLSSLLQTRAAISPAALRGACDKIPWHLLCGTAADDDPFTDRNGIWLPQDADLRPWLESGTAEAMAREGVAIINLFSLWARQDPAEALVRVEDWPGASPRSLLYELLASDAEDRKVVENISRALEALPEEKLQRLTALVKGDRVQETILRFYPA